jgi:hypothetical protein
MGDIIITRDFGTEADYLYSINHYLAPDTNFNRKQFSKFIDDVYNERETVLNRQRMITNRLRSSALRKSARNKYSIEYNLLGQEIVYRLPDIFSILSDDAADTEADAKALYEYNASLEAVNDVSEAALNQAKLIAEARANPDKEYTINVGPLVLTTKINRRATRSVVIDIHEWDNYKNAIIKYHIANNGGKKLQLQNVIFSSEPDGSTWVKPAPDGNTIASLLRNPSSVANTMMQGTRKKRKNTFDHGKLRQYKKVKHQSRRSPQFMDNMNKINIMKCNVATEDINREVTCFPESVVLELRDAYNKNRRNRIVGKKGEIQSKSIDTDDVKTIISQLYHVLQCETEESFLALLPLEKKMEYTYRYFAPNLIRDEKDHTQSGVEMEQFVEVLFQYEDLHKDFVNITYDIWPSPFYTIETAMILYHRKHNKNYVNELLLLQKQDLINEFEYTHVELIRLLRFFLSMDSLNQISVMIGHSRHSQALYINKKDKLFFYYESNHITDKTIYDDERRSLHSINKSIQIDVIKLLHLFSPHYTFMTNSRQQYYEGNCGLHSFLFIITMIDPFMTTKEKLEKVSREIDNDKEVDRRIYDYMNSNMLQTVIEKKDVWRQLRA